MPYLSMPAMPIKIARRRAELAKRGLVAGSVGAFVASIVLAHSSHAAGTAPAKASTSTSTSTATATSRATSSFGQAQVSPATSSQTPSVSTGVS